MQNTLNKYYLSSLIKVNSLKLSLMLGISYENAELLLSGTSKFEYNQLNTLKKHISRENLDFLCLNQSSLNIEQYGNIFG